MERKMGGVDMDVQLQALKDASIRKGKRGIMRVVFGRTGILLGLLLLQLLLLFVIIRFLAQYVYVFFGGQIVFGILMLVIIVNRQENPVFQLTWTALVLLFPVFGELLYLYVEMQPGTRVLAGRIREIDERTAQLLSQDPATVHALQQMGRRTAQLIKYVWKNDGYPVYQNTQGRYFRNPQSKGAGGG